jgi:hypothetical protein
MWVFLIETQRHFSSIADTLELFLIKCVAVVEKPNIEEKYPNVEFDLAGNCAPLPLTHKAIFG